jgi:hypothetical protein
MGISVEKSRAPKRKPDDQVKAFRKAARELGRDESDERFKNALRKIAKHKARSKSASAGQDPPSGDFRETT